LRQLSPAVRFTRPHRANTGAITPPCPLLTFASNEDTRRSSAGECPADCGPCARRTRSQAPPGQFRCPRHPAFAPGKLAPCRHISTNPGRSAPPWTPTDNREPSDGRCLASQRGDLGHPAQNTRIVLLVGSLTHNGAPSLARPSKRAALAQRRQSLLPG